MAINTQKLVIIGINYTVHMFIYGTNISAALWQFTWVSEMNIYLCIDIDQGNDNN